MNAFDPNPVEPAGLPALPACWELDSGTFNGPSWRAYWKGRVAAQEAIYDDIHHWVLIESAAGSALRGFLAANWREQGLNDALARNRSRDVLLWMQIGGMEPRMWEPQALADAAEAGRPVGWRIALCAWHADTLMSQRAAQMLDPRAVSRWAGFNLVDASVDQWESVLDRHEGPWPTGGLDSSVPRGDSFRAQVLRQILDRIALRFDMGLAGGGDEIDWRGSHATRVRRWRMVNDRDEELARLNSLEVLPLPMSWLVPGLR
ncbi:hypothetical protein [Mycobacteroides abscessus]|uniref:hypothetical protein n=1 Tax=Mycobacteroides abscessus TaxID=36809 RepID=UPI0011C459D4|nr:hypothetical protein [Mycobacteroides abscessus]